eukprot:scaffold361004_cov34-Prasinocladus_malaysianus.AAC.2
MAMALLGRGSVSRQVADDSRTSIKTGARGLCSFASWGASRVGAGNQTDPYFPVAPNRKGSPCVNVFRSHERTGSMLKHCQL